MMKRPFSKHILWLLGMLLGLVSACSTSREISGIQRYHTVKRGETLWSLAKLYGVDPMELAHANSLSFRRPQLSAGQQLYIPYDVGSLRGFQNPPGLESDLGLRAVAGFLFQWPLKNVDLSEYFGWRGGRMHEGLDLRARSGTPVYSTADGSVIYAGQRFSGFGRMLIIEHADSWSSMYAHLSRYSVRRGQRVRQGQLIGYSGASGRTTGPHLHFEIRKGADPVDPLLFLPPLKSK